MNQPSGLLRPGPSAGGAVHVLTLTPFYPLAGDDASGCFVSEPLPWLEQAGVANTVLAVRPFYRGPARACGVAPPATWVRYFALPGGLGLSSSGAFLFARLLPLVRKLNSSRRVDLIHAHAPLPCGHAAALLSGELGIPYVVTVHGLDAFSTRQVSGCAEAWCKRVSRMVYRSAHRVVCISERVREEVSRGAVAATRVVYNGVDPRMFSPGEVPEAPGLVVLTVGNLIPVKGHELLLRALAAVKGSFPLLRWEIMGDGPERERLRALAGQLGLADSVHFLGRQSRRQVADAVRRCTVFALPSRFEGLGCVYLEAMSAGKPVIACQGQGIGEIIEHGRNGWLVDGGDPRPMVEALSALLPDSQLRQHIGQAARATILGGLTFAHQADRLSRLYRECLV